MVEHKSELYSSDWIRIYEGTEQECYRVVGYLDAAKLREKRIKELEKENARLKEKNRQFNNEVEDLTAYCNQIGKIKTEVLKLFEHISAR